MQILGLKLPPSSINLPLNISFPVHRRPSLNVIVWGRGIPHADRGPVLAIKATNVTGAPVEVTGVYAGFIHESSLPVEVIFGSRTVKLPLRELAGEPQPPCVLQAGESVLWTANLRQLTDELEEKRLTLMSHSRFLDFNSIDVGKWARRSRSAIMARNVIAMHNQRDLAVVVGDGQGGFHKAAVRWQSPRWWAVLRRRRLPSAITEVEIFEDLLVMYTRGAKGVSLAVDLAHVASVEEDPKVARTWLRSSEVLDSGLPGRVAEEPSGSQGDTAFFNVHDPEKTVVIGLRNERYARLVIEVEEPPKTMAALRYAIS